MRWNGARAPVTAVILMATCLIGLVVITGLTNLATRWTRAART